MVTCTHCGDEHESGLDACPRTGFGMHQPGLCGAIVDRYRIERWIGGGGFGGVYRARHAVVGHPVAVKVLLPEHCESREAVERLFREARTVTEIGSSHIVQVFDAGWTAEQQMPFVVMELVEGADMGAVLKCQRLLPLARVARIAHQTLEALQTAHDRGVVHRDVKPANIMLEGTAADGSYVQDHVKLVDFGISKALSAGSLELTRTNTRMGTPGYAAPEQHISAKAVDARADVYSVAVLVFRALTGRLPFLASTAEEYGLYACTEDPPSLARTAPHVPASVAKAVDRGLARNPEDRWPTARAFAEALRAAMVEAGSGDEAGPLQAPEAARVAGADGVTRPAKAHLATADARPQTPPAGPQPTGGVPASSATQVPSPDEHANGGAGSRVGADNSFATTAPRSPAERDVTNAKMYEETTPGRAGVSEPATAVLPEPRPVPSSTTAGGEGPRRRRPLLWAVLVTFAVIIVGVAIGVFLAWSRYDGLSTRIDTESGLPQASSCLEFAIHELHE